MTYTTRAALKVNKIGLQKLNNLLCVLHVYERLCLCDLGELRRCRKNL